MLRVHDRIWSGENATDGKMHALGHALHFLCDDAQPSGCCRPLGSSLFSLMAKHALSSRMPTRSARPHSVSIAAILFLAQMLPAR